MARLIGILLIIIIINSEGSKASEDKLCARELALGMHYACPESFPTSLLSNPAGLYNIKTSQHILTYEFKENSVILLMSQPFTFLKNAGIGFGFFKNNDFKKTILGISLFKLRNLNTGINLKLIEKKAKDYGFDLGILYILDKLKIGFCLYDLGLDEKFITGISYTNIWDRLTILLNYKDSLGIGCEWKPWFRLGKDKISLRLGFYKNGLTFGFGKRFKTCDISYGYSSWNSRNFISIQLYY